MDKKGLAPFATILIVLFLIFIVELVIFSQHYYHGMQELRLLGEATLLVESSKLETWVRSFQKASELSLRESTLHAGFGSILLPYEFERYYSPSNLPYWQTHNELIEICNDVIEFTLRKFPSSYQSNSGWSDPQNVYSSDNLRASASPPSSSSSTIIYKGFNFEIPESKIEKVEVGVEWYTPNPLSKNLYVSVSWDGGVNWYEKQLPAQSFEIYSFLDFSFATNWSPEKLREGNFSVKLRAHSSASEEDGIIYVDSVKVKVKYRVERNFSCPEEIFKNYFKQKISLISLNYLENYETEYEKLSKLYYRMKFYGTLEPRISIEDENVSLKNKYGKEYRLGFERNFTDPSGNEMKISRSTFLTTYLYSKFGKILKKAIYILENDLINKCIINVCLEDLEKSLGEEEINVSLKYIWRGTSEGKAVAIVNVSIQDNSSPFVTYDLEKNSMKLDFLGLKFAVKVGDRTREYQTKAKDLGLFKQCPSLGMLSSQNICKYFSSGSKKVYEEDGGDPFVFGQCSDSTGEYSDYCFGDLLYEYKPFVKNLCYFEKFYCKDDCYCENGACHFPENCELLKAIINNAYPSQCGNKKYNPRADLNKDGKVDITDLGEFYQNSCNSIFCKEKLLDTSDPCFGCNKNGICERNRGENCANCYEDCPCPLGEICCEEVGECSLNRVCPGIE